MSPINVKGDCVLQSLQQEENEKFILKGQASSMSSEIRIEVNRNGEVYILVNKDNSVLLYFICLVTRSQFFMNYNLQKVDSVTGLFVFR